MARYTRSSKGFRSRGGFVGARAGGWAGSKTPLRNLSKVVTRGGKFAWRDLGTMAASAGAAYMSSPAARRHASMAGNYVKGKFQGLANSAFTPRPSGLRQRYSAIVPTKIVGTGLTKSYQVHGTKLNPEGDYAKFLETCQKIVQHRSNAYPVISGINRQASTEFTIHESASLYSAGGLGFVGTGSADINTSSSVLAGGIVLGRGFRKLYLTKTEVKITITSRSEANINLTMRDLICKHDLVTTSGNTTPIASWSAGLDELIGGASTDYNDPFNKPTLSPNFNDYWVVTDTREIALKAGASHTHSITYHTNCAVPSTRIQSTGFLQEITRALLFTVVGTPVHDAVNTNDVGLSPAGVDILVDQYVTCYVNNKGGTVYGDQAIYSPVTAPRAVADIDIQEEDMSL